MKLIGKIVGGLVLVITTFFAGLFIIAALSGIVNSPDEDGGPSIKENWEETAKPMIKEAWENAETDTTKK